MTSKALVVFSLEPWDGIWRRNQYLIDGLLRADPELRVVFVEPARDLLHDLVSRRVPRRGAGRRAADGYGGRLVLLQPTKWLPRAVGPLADALLRRTVRRAMHRLRMTDARLWINDPGWAHIVQDTGWPALYDMTDDWVAADRGARERGRLVANEGILMRRCAAIVVCSTVLLESRRGIRPDVVLIPNAVDVARYRRPAERPADLPVGRVGLYVGTLHEDRLDVGLVVRTASALHERGAWCVLLGPNALSDANTGVLRRAPGLVVLGARDHTTVPAYLQHADALLVPHVTTGFTESLDPLKLYEYRAVGRPIVSTPVAGFRELGAEIGVTVAPADGFPQVAAAVVTGPAQEVPGTDVPDWADRVEAMSRVIAGLDG